MDNSRKLPNAIDIEYAVLGTMIVYPGAARTAFDAGLEKDDFFAENNKAVFEVIEELNKNSKEISSASVRNIVSTAGLFEKLGGNQYFTSLVSASTSIYDIVEYVEVLRDKAMMRRMIQAAEKIVSDGYTGKLNVTDYLDESERSVLKVSRSRRTEEFIDSISLVDNTLEKIRKLSEQNTDITGVRTSITCLDQMLHGLQKGSLNILAARPSMGKTAFALNLAVNVAANEPNGAVAIFSLEQPAEQIELRILAMLSRINNKKLNTGQGMRTEDWNRLYETASRLKKSNNIYISDSPIQKMPEIFSKCRRLQAEKGLSLIVVDYIGLLSGGRGASTQEMIADYSRSLKALARELDVPVLALSQLSRKVEERPDKRPMMSDLRDSGAIEQDADVVMLLYREAYYKEELREKAAEQGQEKLEINVAKHRNGATGKFEVVFANNTFAIYNLNNSAQEVS